MTTTLLPVTYFSQLDNALSPRNSCNVTCLAMCLNYFGAIGDGSGQQLEDQILLRMEQMGFDRFDMQGMVQFVNEVYGKPLGIKANFSVKNTVESLCKYIESGSPVIVGVQTTASGHFIVLNGCDTVNKTFSALDPFGEFHDSVHEPAALMRGNYDTDGANGIETYSFRLIEKYGNYNDEPIGNIWCISFEKINVAPVIPATPSAPEKLVTDVFAHNLGISINYHLVYAANGSISGFTCDGKSFTFVPGISPASTSLLTSELVAAFPERDDLALTTSKEITCSVIWMWALMSPIGQKYVDFALALTLAYREYVKTTRRHIDTVAQQNAEIPF